jgi:hypothetical protein
MIQEERCIICDEAITNPICPLCLESQVMHWAMDKAPSLMPILREVGSSVMEFTHENTSCVICKGIMNVCAHCYCNEIHSWLKENTHEKLAESFLSHFNFELDYRFDLKASGIKQRHT